MNKEDHRSLKALELFLRCTN